MSSWSRILVHVDGSARSAVRLRVARAVAHTQGAHVWATLAADPPWQVLPIETVGDGGSASLLWEAGAERRRAALDTVESERARPGPPVHWLEGDGQGAPWPSSRDFAAQALCSDLTVMGQHDPDDAAAWGVPTDFVPHTLAASGRAGLVVPWAGAWDERPQPPAHVLIAWKPAREAAAAVAGALPLLKQARVVTVLSWSNGEALAGRDSGDPLRMRRLQVWLSGHGITTRLALQGPAPATGLGELMLSAAADHGADLLVMGCYGHARAREWVFGGVTRTLLGSMTLPVLMAH